MAPAVIIDPGHGGTHTYGGSSPQGVEAEQGLSEKHINLELAQRVAARLGSLAQLTRTGDVNVPLRERAALAARSGAQVLVSLHANSGAYGTRGSEIWLHDAHDRRSAELARSLHENLERVGPTRGVFQGPLAVLDPRDTGGVAACLVEADYLSDPQGRSRLTSSRGLDELADAISTGVRSYLGRSDSGSSRARLGGPVSVRHNVELCPQPRTWGCWAASAAMLKKFQDPQGYYDAYAIAQPLGFTSKLDTGLFDADVATVANHWGFTIAGDQCWSIDGLADLLRRHGPLWVSTASGTNAAHDVCVTGLEGDGTPDGTNVHINNPWPVGRGAVESMTYTAFARIYERRADGFSLVVHASRRLGQGPRFGGGLRQNPAVSPGMTVLTTSNEPSGSNSSGFQVRFDKDDGRISLGSARRVVVWFDERSSAPDQTITVTLIDPSISVDPLDWRSVIAQAIYDRQDASGFGIDFRNIPANGPTTMNMGEVKWRIDIVDNNGRNDTSARGRVYGI